MILILYGDINSGKTKALKNLKKTYKPFNDIAFILSYKRYNVGKREYWIYLNSSCLGRGVVVDNGNIFINDGVFRKLSFLDISSYRWIVIDEIGPLELKKKCFYDIFSKALSMEKNCIISIRNEIVRDVIDFFDIKDYHLFKVNEWEKIAYLLCS